MSDSDSMRVIHTERIFGLLLDEQTRCVHYNTPLDIIAIKFKCCGQWYSCFECHSEAADHKAKVWPQDEYYEKAILCGMCGYQLTVDEYLNCGNSCPNCDAAFNPGCAKHYHLYFEQ
jgi:uncharacterized CHY-type Zn-finger protein